MSDSLWSQVGACFDTDDGSLPGVEVTRLSAASVAAVYAMLRQRSRPVGPPPEFWCRVRDAAVAVDAVPDAASLVAAGQAEPFHHGIAGVVAGGVELPALGVFVWPDAVELDYRMGAEWTPAAVGGFFEVLGDCCDLAPEAVVRPADFEGPPAPDQFTRAWYWYRGSRPGWPAVTPARLR